MKDLQLCPICIGSEDEMIQCDVCGQWYHTECVGVQAEAIASYHCEECSKKHGPSEARRKLKRARVNIDYVALDAGEVFAVDKSMHPHVSKFIGFDRVADGLCVDILDELTFEYATTLHLPRPILVPNADLQKIGMELPTDKEKITIDYILDKVGEDTAVEVMDVLSQQGVTPGWKMRQWRDYFSASKRDRIRNVISLEVSQVDGFGKQFKRPDMVEQLDLIDKTWKEADRPQVTKYCLMSVEGSYTDFHIDFGGTSVYYTVLSGAKTFLMIPPTEENLKLYTLWCHEPNQNYTWFPEYKKSINGKAITPQEGFKVTLNPGDVFIIPSGWIHAVYTPQDSLVIGGNFLTIMNIKKQLRILQIEKETHVPMKFRHPQFNKVLWLASWYYVNHPDEFVQDIGFAPVKKEALEETSPQIIVHELLTHLEAHYELSKSSQVARKSIPTHLIGKDVPKYLQTLQKWLHSYDSM